MQKASPEERRALRSAVLCNDSNAQDYRAKIDFTGKMKGNCIFNNLLGQFGGSQVGGISAVRKSHHLFLEIRLAPPSSQKDHRGLHFLIKKGQWILNGV